MIWLFLGTLCLIYYAVLECFAGGQPFCVVWPLLAALFYMCFFFREHRRRHGSWKTPLWFRTFCITSLILFLVLIGVVGSRVLTTMLSRPDGGLSYIVLLTQEEIVGETQQEQEERMNTAVRYLQKNPEARVIVSGGWDSERGASQAYTTYQYLISCGIPANRILWEIRSENVAENLQYSMNIAGGPQERIGIVASDYYTYRAARIGRSVGLVQPDTIPASTTWWLYPHRLAAEIFYVLQDKFLGI